MGGSDQIHNSDPFDPDAGDQVQNSGAPIMHMAAVVIQAGLDNAQIRENRAMKQSGGRSLYADTENDRVYDMGEHEPAFVWNGAYQSKGTPDLKVLTSLNAVGSDIDTSNLTPAQARLAYLNNITTIGIVQSGQEYKAYNQQGGTLLVGGLSTVPVDFHPVSAGDAMIYDLPPDTDSCSQKSEYKAPRGKRRLCVRPMTPEDSMLDLATAATWYLSNRDQFTNTMGDHERTWELVNSVRSMFQYDIYALLFGVRVLMNHGLIGIPRVAPNPAAALTDTYAYELQDNAPPGSVALAPSDNVWNTGDDLAKENAVRARTERFVENLGVMLEAFPVESRFGLNSATRPSVDRRMRVVQVKNELLANLYYQSGDIEAEYGYRVGNAPNAAMISGSGEPDQTTPAGFLRIQQGNFATHRAHLWMQAVERKRRFHAGTAYASANVNQQTDLVQ